MLSDPRSHDQKRIQLMKQIKKRLANKSKPKTIQKKELQISVEQPKEEVKEPEPEPEKKANPDEFEIDPETRELMQKILHPPKSPNKKLLMKNKANKGDSTTIAIEYKIDPRMQRNLNLELEDPDNIMIMQDIKKIILIDGQVQSVEDDLESMKRDKDNLSKRLTVLRKRDKLENSKTFTHPSIECKVLT